MKKIVQEPNIVLRQIAEKVTPDYIKSKEFSTILKELKDALNSEDDGVAIAAPQLGYSIRVFVVAKKASEKFKGDTVFINPKIIKLGIKKTELSEGCLSVRWKYGLVKRSLSATVKALNEKGNEFVVNGRGLLAQIFQHETDHLDGILFIDKAKHIEDLPPIKNTKNDKGE